MNRASQRLAKARPSSLDGPPAPLDLPAITAQPQQRAGRPAPTRRRLVLAAAAFTAVASIIAVGNAVNLGNAVNPGGEPPRPLPHTVAAPTGRQALLVAAQLAAAESQPTGRYWVRRIDEGTLFDVGGYSVLGRTDRRTWTPLVVGGRYAGCTQWLGAAPATDADREAWRRAGSPDTWDLPGHKGEQGRRLTTQPGDRFCKSRPESEIDFYLVGTTLTLEQLRALPTDPAQLKELLLRDETATGGTWRWDDPTEPQSERLFRAATNLILRMPVSGPVRAAAYRMLADLPGITFPENATDPLGRHGSAVEHIYHNTGGNHQRYRMLIDLATGQPLAGEQRDDRSGVLTSYEAVTESAYSDEEPPASH